jgi:hypothetical protein
MIAMIKLDFPEGYKVETLPERKTISLNGRDFAASEFIDLTTTRPDERIHDHARRLAQALGVGCVTTR